MTRKIIEKKTENYRKRKIIWFNSPYRLNISTNTVKAFFSQLVKHFRKSHKLHKFLIRNNVSKLVIVLLLILKE